MRTTKPLDREEMEFYNLTVTALDGGSNPLSSTAIVYIQVKDVNDNPPEFQNESYVLFVAENETRGITLIKVRK